jgi:hypothetical protein
MGDNLVPQSKSQISEALLRSFFFDALSFPNVSELGESRFFYYFFFRRFIYFSAFFSVPALLGTSGLQNLILDVGKQFVPSSSCVEQSEYVLSLND